MSYTFRLPIGDWSDDGHGDCHWYDVESTKPVEDVREAYFTICKKLGTGLSSDFKDSPCSNYGDHTISLKWLKKVGLSVNDLVDIDFDTQNDDSKDDEVITYSPTTIAELFILFMNKHDRTLNLKLIKNTAAMFPFYGYDSKKRHIGNMGYGCTGRD